ncbi:hypothetical protein VCRA2119O147_260039 [Vibrio crassostreae]|nr:hypothetical protein VCRA2119O147_260039 [Vibrio crassostreae]CAK2823645.1 hypothetical protein VCRA2110O183_330034 [Vibrio crassostreae]CAK2908133.1 hypothetical protein VCRA2121O264_330035 [Vibrio crassostreae]CAK3577586.1 hypothetical protein VCRA2121O262_340036 [Vibrio crassostreae]
MDKCLAIETLSILAAALNFESNVGHKQTSMNPQYCFVSMMHIDCQ